MTSTGNDHEHSNIVTQAAMWLVEQRPHPQPVVPALKERFGLSAREACDAIVLAERFRTNRSAFA